MPFVLHKVLQTDIPKLIEIEFDAYASSPASKLLRARDADNIEHHKRAHRRYNELLLQRDRHNFYQIIDTDAVDTIANIPRAIRDYEPHLPYPPNSKGKVIGWFWFEVFPETIGRELHKPPDEGFTAYEWPMVPQEHRSLVKSYWEEMEQEKRLHLDWSRPHIELCLIVICPSYQRRGVGTHILRHLCHLADVLQLPVLCQASVEGRALYEKFGFKTRRVSRFPTHWLGIPGERVLWGMVREPAATETYNSRRARTTA